MKKKKATIIIFLLMLAVLLLYNTSQTLSWISNKKVYEQDTLSFFMNSKAFKASKSALLGKLIQTTYKGNTVINLPDALRTYTMKEKLAGLDRTEKRLRRISERFLRLFAYPLEVKNTNYSFAISRGQLEKLRRASAIRVETPNHRKKINLIKTNAPDIGFYLYKREITVSPISEVLNGE